jgi:hypothetical protein
MLLKTKMLTCGEKFSRTFWKHEGKLCPSLAKAQRRGKLLGIHIDGEEGYVCIPCI